MRLQLASPAEHPDLGLLPFGTDLSEWSLPSIHEVSGLHRHVVRLVELGRGAPPPLLRRQGAPRPPRARREYRLLRGLADDELPTVDVVAAVTGRTGDRDGLLVTRHLDYSLPYRSLLSGRGPDASRTSASGCSTPSSGCSCACTWPASSGATARCRTRCSAATPVPCQAYVIDVETSRALPDR